MGPKRRQKFCVDPVAVFQTLLTGTIARPGDVTIRRWMNGKDGAIDVTVTSPLSRSNVAGAAAEAGASLAKACQRKERDTAEAC